MVGDGTAFRVPADQCIVVPALDSALGHFTSVLDGMDLEIDPMTQQSPQLGINGPRSRELLQGLTSADVSAFRYFRFLSGAARGGPQARRTGSSRASSTGPFPSTAPP